MTDVTKNFTPQFLFLDQKIVVKFVFFLLRGVRSADADVQNRYGVKITSFIKFIALFYMNAWKLYNYAKCNVWYRPNPIHFLLTWVLWVGRYMTQSRSCHVTDLTKSCSCHDTHLTQSRSCYVTDVTQWFLSFMSRYWRHSISFMSRY